MGKLKIMLVSRFPKLDVLDYRKRLVDELLNRDFCISIIYSSTSIGAYIKEGIRRYKTNFMKELTNIIASKYFRFVNKSLSVYQNQTLMEYAKHKDIPVSLVKKINSTDSLKKVSTYNPDILILLGSEIVKRDLLSIPKMGTINSHYALLPKYRGMNVTEWSIFHEDKVGVTVHFVETGIDMGDILNQECINMENVLTLDNVRQKIRDKSVDLLVKTCIQIRENSLKRIKQNQQDGKQYFEMHSDLRKITELKIGKYNE